MEERKYELIKFNDGDFSLDVKVSPREDTLWISQKQIAALFDSSIIFLFILKIFIKNKSQKKIELPRNPRQFKQKETEKLQKKSISTINEHINNALNE